MIDDDDGATRHQPIVDRAGIPIPYVLARELRHGILHRGIWVIDQNHIAAATEHAAIDADCVINAARAGVPFAFGLAISRKPGFEQAPIFRAIDDVANLSPKVSCQARDDSTGRLRWSPHI